MSEWYEAEDDEIDICLGAEEVRFFVTANDNGRIYLYISFEKFLKLAEEVKKANESKATTQ